ARAFSGKVGTGLPQKMRPLNESRAKHLFPFLAPKEKPRRENRGFPFLHGVSAPDWLEPVRTELTSLWSQERLGGSSSCECRSDPSCRRGRRSSHPRAKCRGSCPGWRPCRLNRHPYG